MMMQSVHDVYLVTLSVPVSQLTAYKKDKKISSFLMPSEINKEASYLAYQVPPYAPSN